MAKVVVGPHLHDGLNEAKLPERDQRLVGLLHPDARPGSEGLHNSDAVGVHPFVPDGNRLEKENKNSETSKSKTNNPRKQIKSKQKTQKLEDETTTNEKPTNPEDGNPDSGG